MSCDIFWSPHYNIPLAPIRAKKRLLTIHDVFHLAFIDQLSFKQKIYARSVLNSAVKISDLIVTVSNFSKSEIVKYTKTGRGKITVIHNGIDTEKFRELDDAALIPVKKKYDMPEKFILFVGNVKPHKNLKRLLGAYEILIKKGITDYDLVIVGKKEGFITGDSEVFSILNNNSILREKVLFAGYIDNSDLPAVYNLASLLVFPSLYEGFGLPPLEAMACGCPTVVSNAASLPEVCGDAAYYIDPYDIENMAEGMDRVLNDDTLRQDLIKKGFEREGLFSWGESSMEHLKIFDEILRS
jgi:glycosyltransferase involved in cell wall biosynthesis